MDSSPCSAVISSPERTGTGGRGDRERAVQETASARTSRSTENFTSRHCLSDGVAERGRMDGPVPRQGRSGRPGDGRCHRIRSLVLLQRRNNRGERKDSSRYQNSKVPGLRSPTQGGQRRSGARRGTEKNCYLSGSLFKEGSVNNPCGNCGKPFSPAAARGSRVLNSCDSFRCSRGTSVDEESRRSAGSTAVSRVPR